MPSLSDSIFATTFSESEPQALVPLKTLALDTDSDPRLAIGKAQTPPGWLYSDPGLNSLNFCQFEKCLNPESWRHQAPGGLVYAKIWVVFPSSVSQQGPRGREFLWLLDCGTAELGMSPLSSLLWVQLVPF